MRDIIIIGSGPAGLTAAIYAARANLKPLVLEGLQPGGQLTITTEVENFPGFPEGVMGPELMDIMRRQAERFGSEHLYSVVNRVHFQPGEHRVGFDDKAQTARAVIIATGASARMLGLKNEAKLMGRGLSACATCDGFFFRDKEIAVVGGGDSALEEATFLTRFASKVTVLHRRDELRGSKIMQERAMANPKIQFLWSTVVEELLSESGGSLNGLRLRNVKTDETWEQPIDGLFYAIGHLPNTRFLEGQVELADSGYVLLKEHTQTSVEGVFAAGDVADRRYRQAISAAGMGCQAALDAEKYLESLG